MKILNIKRFAAIEKEHLDSIERVKRKAVLIDPMWLEAIKIDIRAMAFTQALVETE